MKNVLYDHPSPTVRGAAIALCDALTQYERSTGREYLIIIKADAPGGVCQYRSLSGGPAPEHHSDDGLLEAFSNVAEG